MASARHCLPRLAASGSFGCSGSGSEAGCVTRIRVSSQATPSDFGLPWLVAGNHRSGHLGRYCAEGFENRRMTTMTHPPTLRKPTEGRTIAVVGDLYRFLATGDETDGKYAMFEAIVPPGGGPPPHVHSREEESFYILEGEITFQIGTQRHVTRAGMFANMS